MWYGVLLVHAVMKIKRYKQARRVLDFYKRNFSFHEPFQIIGKL